LVNFYQTTRRYNPEDSHLRTNRRENLKSYSHINVRVAASSRLLGTVSAARIGVTVLWSYGILSVLTRGRVRFPEGAQNLKSLPAPGPTQCPIRKVPGVERPEHEANYSPPSSVAV
jgi:hypothetical protein